MKKIIPFDDYNLRFHPGSDFVGTVLPTWGNYALTNGWKLLEVYEDNTCGRLQPEHSDEAGCDWNDYNDVRESGPSSRMEDNRD